MTSTKIEQGIKKIEKLLQLVGNPQNSFKAIHVAGTNGKGSTTLMLSSILDAAKYKTCSFTSPHLITEQDSIRIGGGLNGRTVDDDLYHKAREIIQENNSDICASHFEVLTATAFLVFKMAAVDIAVIEVGLGGLLDATNIIPPPLVCVICRIAIDHTEFLGNTIAEIASQKAGIIKENSGACVISLQPYEESLSILTARATETCKLDTFFASSANVEIESPNAYTVSVEFPFNEKLLVSPSLSGDYQRENIATACKVACVLFSKGYSKITSRAVTTGLSTCSNPGRLEWIQTKAYGMLCLDGAHNLDGMTALGDYLVKKRKNSNIAFIIGFSGEKDTKSLIEKLGCWKDDQIFPVRFSEPEGMPWIHPMDPGKIGKTCNPRNYRDCGGSLENALKMINRTETRIVVVCGSLYLVADVHRLFTNPVSAPDYSRLDLLDDSKK